MSTATTHQSLQSCLEPLLFEPRDQQLLLPFPFPTQNLEHPSLSKLSLTSINGELPPKAYVHPLSRNSFLSSKSLEMCTESLGSETGCGIDRSSHLPPPPAEDLKTPTNKAKTKQQPTAAFPPPLTSIGGGVEVQTHREGGRLVIKAVASSSNCSVFQAERGNGRLRLSIVKDEEAEADGGYNVKEEVDGGKVWSSSSRCNGERSRSRRKKLQNLQFCVVGVWYMILLIWIWRQELVVSRIMVSFQFVAVILVIIIH